MIIIHRLLVLILITVCYSMSANADGDKSFKCKNNIYSSTGREKSNSDAVYTGFNWSDSKGKSYPIYISASGSCYIIRVSAKTNKEYKQYLKPDVSQDICNKLGKEYKVKKK